MQILLLVCLLTWLNLWEAVILVEAVKSVLLSVLQDSISQLLDVYSRSVERCYFPCFCRKQPIPLPGNLEAIHVIYDVLMLQSMPVCCCDCPNFSSRAANFQVLLYVVDIP